MIKVKIFNSKGKLVSEKEFESASALAAYYRSKEYPYAPDRPSDGCWNCMLYDPSKGACTKEWNNGNERHYLPERDNKEPDDYCDDHDYDPEAEWIGGDE